MANIGNQLRPRLADSAPGFSAGSMLRFGIPAGRALALVTAGLVLLGMFGVIRPLVANAMPVRFIQLEGAMWQTDPEQLRRVVVPAVRGGYFGVNLSEVEEAVRESAWIDNVEVARVWPDRLRIRVEEHRPIARWGNESLLGERGEAFSPGNVGKFASLPQLSGPPGQEKAMLGVLQTLNGRMEPLEQQVAALRLSRRRAWQLRLSGGLDIECGKQDPRAAVEHLLALAPKLGVDPFMNVRRVDLRYSGGIAVVFRPEATAIPGP